MRSGANDVFNAIIPRFLGGVSRNIGLSPGKRWLGVVSRTLRGYSTMARGWHPGGHSTVPPISSETAFPKFRVDRERLRVCDDLDEQVDSGLRMRDELNELVRSQSKSRQARASP